MPLNPTGPDLSFFANPPGDPSELAEAWAKSLSEYVTAIAPPVVTPAVVGFRTALKEGLIPIFSAPFPPPPLTIDAVISAAVIGALVPSMAATTTGLVVVPPPSPIVLLPVGPLFPDPGIAARAQAAKIHSWFITGTATLSGATSDWK